MPSSALWPEHAPQKSWVEAGLRDCNLNHYSLLRHQSSASGSDDHFCGIRHGFENDYAVNRNDVDAGFEIDAVGIETAPATGCQ